MNALTQAERRLGFWSALSVVVLDAVYVATGVVWLIAGGFSSPEPFQPAEPYLTILEILLFLSVPALVVVMIIVRACAAADRKTFARVALAFTIMFAVVTSGVHFVQLTLVRQMKPEMLPELAAVRLYPWPFMSLALDLLAWDFLLGLALLFAAPVFTGGKLERVIRISMTITGALCLIGTLGPASGEMRIQYLAIFGYAFALPTVCAMLAVLFRRMQRESPGTSSRF